MESISSGVNFLRRRFSSQDNEEDEKSTPASAPGGRGPQQQQAQYQQQQQSSHMQNGPPNSFSLASLANKVSSAISAPTSPSKQSMSMYSQVQGITKNLMQAASNAAASYIQGPHKCILIIDDQQIDWSKYFRSNRTGWQLRIEQAPFSEIHVCCHSNRKCTVDILESGKEHRRMQPDFVLFRQNANSEKGDYTNIVIALLKGGVQTLNSPESIRILLDKNWTFNRLQWICETTGPNAIPLIEQTYYPLFDHFSAQSRFPIVIRVGHGSHGLGKMKIEDENHMLEVENMLRSIKPVEVVIEPFIETKYDIHLQKIGTETRAYIRKGISNDWKSNASSAMLEKIALSNRQKQWLSIISDAFGGLEVFGIDILVAKDGREIVHDVNDAITLLGDTQEDDRRAIADLIQAHIIQSAQRVTQQIAATRIGIPPVPPPRPQSANVSRSSTSETNISGETAVNNDDKLGRKNSIGQKASQLQRSVRQPSKQGKEPSGSNLQQQQHQDDTMGQLKRTFAGIFGEVQ
ncbi:Synapsin, ATP binding domain protein [Onchocerca flexuosa]|uniref:Synapsin, ATP binding domain protein n=1 Tax=Onchocerca flexuosa TaxID=387005 RepID=A0A238BRN5_9BILA|nr:Synapsin, ATP binding domain protein [Onchocerca flexuosa]